MGRRVAQCVAWFFNPRRESPGQSVGGTSSGRSSQRSNSQTATTSRQPQIESRLNLRVSQSSPERGRQGMPPASLSLHARSSIHQELIGGLEADQTDTWVLDVEHDIDDDDG